jgi:hypothetical protein
VQTCAGDTLISTWPFASTKCSAWLVSKESPRVSGFKAGYTKSATASHPTLLSSSPYSLSHKKAQGLKMPLFPTLKTKTYVQECLHICLPVRSSGVCNMWPVSRQVASFSAAVQRNRKERFPARETNECTSVRQTGIVKIYRSSLSWQRSNFL